MSVVMAAVPPHERPRERLLARGAEALADRELIALVLRNGAPDTSALDLAGELLADYRQPGTACAGAPGGAGCQAWHRRREGGCARGGVPPCRAEPRPARQLRSRCALPRTSHR